MKVLDSRIKPVIEMSTALMTYADKGYGEFRYDGFLYKVLDDRIMYRSLSSVDEYIIKRNNLQVIKYNIE